MKQPSLLTCFLLFALISSPLAFGQEATQEPKVQEQTQQESKVKEQAQQETKAEETKRLTVSTEKNMVKKPGNITIGVCVKRKGILLVPVVVLKAKRPSLQDRDTASEEQPKP
jgi:hypothetical protein